MEEVTPSTRHVKCGRRTQTIFIARLAQCAHELRPYRSAEPSERHAAERGHGLHKRFEMVDALIRRQFRRVREGLERRKLRIVAIVGAVAGELVFGHAPGALHAVPCRLS